MENQADIEDFKDSSSDGNNNGNPTEENRNEIPDEEVPPKPKVKFDPDGFHYDMSGEKHLVVFNHYEFHHKAAQKQRQHTGKDVIALEETFKSIGFNVDVYHDRDRETIWDILLELRKTDYSAVSCLCIVILTHGSKEGLLYAYDKHYYLKDVITLFEKHPTLAGKPKLFFIQACRGNNIDDGSRIETDGEEKGNYFVIPSQADFLILRSTVEDYVSYSDGRGSWMIQELCTFIRKYRSELDILQIVTLIQRQIAFQYASYSATDIEKSNKRVMLETTFTLTKFLKF